MTSNRWLQLGSAHDKPGQGVWQGRERGLRGLEASVNGTSTWEAGQLEQARQAVAAQPGHLAIPSAVRSSTGAGSCLPSCFARLPALPERRLHAAARARCPLHAMEATALAAASSRSLAEIRFMPLVARISLPRSTLVPSRRTMSGTLTPTCGPRGATAAQRTNQRRAEQVWRAERKERANPSECSASERGFAVLTSDAVHFAVGGTAGDAGPLKRCSRVCTPAFRCCPACPPAWRH